MGNSEVGHMNIGAGRIISMDLGQIDLEIENENFFKKSSRTFWSNYYSNNLTTNYLDKNLVSLLIKNGANINQKDQRGKTILHSVIHFSWSANVVKKFFIKN